MDHSLKRTLGIIGILTLGIMLFFILSDEKETQLRDRAIEMTPYDLLKTAKITIPESTSTLVLLAGKGRVSDGGVPYDVALGEGYIVRTNYTTQQIATTISVNTGGGGIFTYLALFDVNGGIVTERGYGILGDRIKISNIRYIPSGVVVEYYDRLPGEPITEPPTVRFNKTFTITETGLTEVRS